jgi:hypothetical protein
MPVENVSQMHANSACLYLALPARSHGALPLWLLPTHEVQYPARRMCAARLADQHAIGYACGGQCNGLSRDDVTCAISEQGYAWSTICQRQCSGAESSGLSWIILDFLLNVSEKL